ncbi:putative NRPS-like protein biosynthetic cluster [Lecanicillium sp. MT-2017a]|nr:putative NRPS-like protein biosynthetic cluster [Lecanicillium sp. MT-2017a]
MASAKPLHGQRLLSHVIDERARDKHPRPFAALPRSTNVKDGFEDISYVRFANAINRAAGWLRDTFGTPDRPETVMYMAPFDFRYQILALAAVKSRHIMFFPSPRNAPDALSTLLQEASCTKIVTSATPPRPLQTVLDRSADFHHVVVPELSFFLDETPVPEWPLEATFQELRYEPWVIIHTSGSTGNSKLVTLRHGYATTLDAFHLFEQNDTNRFWQSRQIMPFPPFHVAGITFSLPVTLFYDATVIPPPVGAPLTADLVHSMQQQTTVDHYILPPALVTDLTKNKEYLAALGGLKGLTFSGGPLGADAARMVSEKTRLSSGFGASEYGTLPSLPRDPEDWQYFKFNAEGGGMDFRPTETSDLFELVFVRKPSADLVQSIFVNYPDLNEYHTKDLFSKHPTKPGLYKYESRLDDIIVFENGENLNPVPMEGVLTSSPDVKACLVVGQGRPQTAALVEAADENMKLEDLIERLKPYISRANKSCPAYAKLSPGFVFKVPAGQAFQRAPKGTIQRSKSIAQFNDEINQLYTGTGGSGGAVPSLDCSSPEALTQSLREYLQTDLGVEKIGQDDDFFALGMDSLSVINLTRAINVSRSGKDIAPADTTMVYENPTLAKLCRAMQAPPRTRDYSDFDEDSEEDKAAWTDMEKQYRDLIQLHPGSSQSSKRDLLRSNRPPPLYQPDGGLLAWSQVIGAFLVNLNNWGLVNSFGVYQSYYQTTLLASHSPSTISWIGTVQGVLLLLVGVVSGPLFDRGYFRAILVGAGLCLVVALMLLSLATEYYQIMLCQGILIGVCLGLLYIPSVALIPLYFKKRRGLALGVATAGGSVGGVIYPIIFRRLIEETSFGWANRIVGFVSLASLCLATALLKPIGKRSVRKLVDTSALSEVPYLAFLAAAFFLFAGVLVPYFLVPTFASLPPISSSEDRAFYFLPVLNAAQFFGRVGSGALSDRTSPELILLVGELGAGVLGFCWIAVRSEAGVIVWMVFYGLVSGVIATLPAAVLPYICPNLAVLGTRLGMLYAVAGLGVLLSTPVALAIDRDAGGFLGAQLWVGACCIVGTMFYLVTCQEAWKRRRLYESRKR